jgi:hypothetical protein
VENGRRSGKLRHWLDHNRIAPVNFDICHAATGALLVRIVFKDEREAERFQQDFGR